MHKTSFSIEISRYSGGYNQSNILKELSFHAFIGESPVTVITITHDREEAVRMADQVVQLKTILEPWRYHYRSLLLGPLSRRLKMDPGLMGTFFMTGSIAIAFLIFYTSGIPDMDVFGLFSGSIL
jgi:hypothetical protein